MEEGAAWRLNRRSGSDLTGIATDINPQVRGWFGYYGAFYRSELGSLAARIDDYLVRWAMHKYKRLRSRPRRAWAWLNAVRQRQPDLFAIAIGFDELATDDLSLTDEQKVKARVTSPAERNAAGQLVAFAYRMQVGDLVIVPRLTAKHRDYLVARITGPYQHVDIPPASGHHRRPVLWLGSFSRESLSRSAINTLGAISTIFRPTAVEAELRGFLTALTPLDSQSPSLQPATPVGSPPLRGPGALPIAVVPPAHPLTKAQLDIELDSNGRARISCAHPALLMEQTPRHVDPGPDWAGVAGIYVLTGTYLQQSSTRTGNERTLTVTLIVRPWAYVGLSEDFQSRLGSHRQSKPEWRRALLVRGGAQPFGSDDIKYLEQKVHAVLEDTGEVFLAQTTPRGNLSAHPRNPARLDACADTIVAVLRLTGTLI
jgi:hypothetical protein